MSKHHRDYHTDEAEKLLESARAQVKGVSANFDKETGLSKADALALRLAEFAVQASQAHAQLALVTPPKDVAHVGGYA